MSQDLYNSKDMLLTLFAFILIFSFGSYFFTCFIQKMKDRRASRKLEKIIERHSRFSRADKIKS